MGRIDDWEAVKTEYLTTEKTLRQIADARKLGAANLRNRASKENWVEQRKHFQVKVANLTQEKKSVALATESAQFDADCLRVARKGIDLVETRLKHRSPLLNVNEQSTALKNFQTVGRVAFGENPEKPAATDIHISVVSKEAADLTKRITAGEGTELSSGEQASPAEIKPMSKTAQPSGSK